MSATEPVSATKTLSLFVAGLRACVLLLRGLLALLLLVLATRATAATWQQEAYVWQRDVDSGAMAAITSLVPRLPALHVLAAEVTWTPAGQPRVVRPRWDYAALARSPSRIGLVVRIGPFSGAFASDDARATSLAAVLAGVLAEARGAGLAPAELQIDFDCAEAKLAGYRVWLEAFRRAVGETPLTITTLPAWLARSEFTALVRATDGFVLQVHSLDRPRAGPHGAYALCDPERALAWAEQASEVGVPFRIALPTYGYLLAFDAAGKFFALAAEGPRPAWPAGTQIRAVRTDAPAMATLAQRLAARPPAHGTGVIWFRLPVAGDRLNWDTTTFAAVLRGDTPRREIDVAVEWSAPGLAEIVVLNRGETTETFPENVSVTWPAGARLRAGDALGGFILEEHATQAQAILLPANIAPEAALGPGRRRKIAWLRFDRELSLDVRFSPPR